MTATTELSSQARDGLTVLIVGAGHRADARL